MTKDPDGRERARLYVDGIDYPVMMPLIERFTDSAGVEHILIPQLAAYHLILGAPHAEESQQASRRTQGRGGA